jgi:hypothetical protein
MLCTVGGALTQAYSWRATFYFIAVLAGISFVRPALALCSGTPFLTFHALGT